jgi:FdhD protein
MEPDRRSERVDMRRWEGGVSARTEDWLAVEEPLEIVVEHGGASLPLLTTMRTPGNDAELAVGLLHAERVVRRREDVLSVSHTDDPRVPRENRENRVIVRLHPDCSLPELARGRPFLSSAACGVCGRAVVDDLTRALPPLPTTQSVSAPVLNSLGARLREEQSTFHRTGGIHATGLFDLGGDLILRREDIGRHNATDAVVGASLLAGQIPLDKHIALVTGRVGYEIVQKCWVAGVPILAAIGAPSSLAVDMALEANMTLAGFLRDGRFNVYSAPERIAE